MSIIDFSGTVLYHETTSRPGNRQVDVSKKVTPGGTYLLQVQMEGEATPITWKVLVIQ